MKNINLHGKSLVLNIVLIVLNLTGLTFLAIGYHENFESSATLFKSLGYIFFLLGILGLFLLNGIQLFSYVARILVGGLFIVSGLIKANDPLGFAYKLEEYFEDGALAYRVKDLFGWETFTLEWLIDYALPISIAICVFEILLGVLVIIGSKLKMSAFLMLGMMVFFTLLTWHTKECDPNAKFLDVDTYALVGKDANVGLSMLEKAAYDENVVIRSQTDKEVVIAEMKGTQCVSDCGCFGDALKGSVGRSLSPSESFWKDLVLSYLVLLIFIASFKSKPNTAKQNLVMVTGGVVVTVFFSYVFGWYFPIIFGLICVLGALWVKRMNNKLIGNDYGAMLWVILVCSLFVGYVMMYLPVKDYRPYAENSDLWLNMNDGKPGIYTTNLIYKEKATGNLKTFTQEEFNASTIWSTDKDKWEYVESKTTAIIPTKLPSIDSTEFNPNKGLYELTGIEKNMPYVKALLAKNKVKYVNVIDKSDGSEYPQLLAEFYPADWDTTQYIIGDTVVKTNESLAEVSIRDLILTADNTLVIFSKQLNKAVWTNNNIDKIKNIVQEADKLAIPVAMVVNGSDEEIEKFRSETGIQIPTFINDEKILKAVSRANPTLMLFQKGIVKAKYPHRSIPSWELLKEKLSTK